MGIKDEFHQKAILVCVDELCRRSNEGQNDNMSMDNNASASEHRLEKHSFTSLERCDKCNKYMRGLLHQGFICQGERILSICIAVFISFVKQATFLEIDA